jgi:hypothetical protein
MVVERTRGRMAAAAAALAAALGCCCAVDQRFLRLGVGAACGRRPVRSRLRIAAALRRTRVGSGVAAVVPVVVGDRVIAVAAGGARLTVVHSVHAGHLLAVQHRLFVVGGATPVVPPVVPTAAPAPGTAEMPRGQIADALVHGVRGLVAGSCKRTSRTNEK